jgi:hypothetical protein
MKSHMPEAVYIRVCHLVRQAVWLQVFNSTGLGISLFMQVVFQMTEVKSQYRNPGCVVDELKEAVTFSFKIKQHPTMDIAHINQCSILL